MIFLLSNRDRNQLLVRSGEVRLALPAPVYELDDPLEWARRHIQEDVRHLVVDAEETELVVQPENHLRDLTGVLGSILAEDRVDRLMAQDALLLRLDAVVATLRPDKPRHRAQRLNWPLRVLRNGRPWPAPPTPQETKP